MEFWGVEVKPNQTVKCEPGEDKYLHLSHAALAELKKAAENVVIYVTFNNQKLVIGTLSAEKCAQLNYDLVFEKEFELSHNSKTATVHFTGYKSLGDGGSSDFEFDSEDEEEEAEVAAKTNGAIKAKPTVEKDDKAQKTKAGKPSKVEQKADDDDDSDDDEDSDDEDMVEAGDSDEEDDDSDDEEEDDDDSSEEETPKPAKGKKRPAEAAKKEAESEKKTKLATPAESKKGGEAKKGATTPAKSDKGKQQTPKSAGSVSCKSCSKTFNSEGALDSHSKAKHAAK